MVQLASVMSNSRIVAVTTEVLDRIHSVIYQNDRLGQANNNMGRNRYIS